MNDSYAEQQPSVSLFALTLGLSKPPREFGLAGYSTQLLPPWMTRLDDYAQGAQLMAGEPADRMPPFAIVDYAAIDSGVPAPPYVLSIFGPDRLSNWDGADLDFYRDKRARWQDAIARYLDRFYPGLAGAVTTASFNTALSVRQYLNAPEGAVYGFAPTPHAPQLFAANGSAGNLSCFGLCRIRRIHRGNPVRRRLRGHDFGRGLAFSVRFLPLRGETVPERSEGGGSVRQRSDFPQKNLSLVRSIDLSLTYIIYLQ